MSDKKDVVGYRVEVSVKVTTVRDGYNASTIQTAAEHKTEPSPTLLSATQEVDRLVKQAHREVVASLKSAIEAEPGAPKPVEGFATVPSEAPF